MGSGHGDSSMRQLDTLCHSQREMALGSVLSLSLSLSLSSLGLQLFNGAVHIEVRSSLLS